MNFRELSQQTVGRESLNANKEEKNILENTSTFQSRRNKTLDLEFG